MVTINSLDIYISLVYLHRCVISDSFDGIPYRKHMENINYYFPYVSKIFCKHYSNYIYILY